MSLRVWLCYINIHRHVTGIYTNGNRAIILHRYIMAKLGSINMLWPVPVSVM
ncbi:MAG TPA: hypothetical protein VFX43_17285 [Chitinophagaceae bacterium]|nr:hypothetical protein [Chitinophagaceae bacterium]